MVRFLAGRLQAGIIVLFVVSLVTFGLNTLAPGDAALHVLQNEGVMAPTAAELHAMRQQLHLDDPVPLQYLHWLGNAVHGDFGQSYISGQPVRDLYLQRVGNTALLAACAAALSALVSLPLGILAAYRRGGFLDAVAQLVAVLGSAMPGFWIGLLAVWLFAVKLHWLPAFGSPTPKGVVLPACVLALANTATLTRLTRAATLDVLHREFLTVAHAKGLPAGLVSRRHMLPNIMVPIITVIGLDFANLLTGAAVVEYIFAWPGIGKLAVESALQRDAPVIVGFTVAAGVFFVLVNLAVDLAVAFLDPRVRRA